jgi:creatinine amidohydrolase
MRTVQFERLRPDEIIAQQKRKSIVYLAFGPLEWHGPHLPFGTDPLTAYAIALRVAERTGGVVMPPLYCGTERERSPELVEAFGLPPSTYVVGMDVPAVSVPSYYFKEDVFGLIVREHIRLLVAHKYKLIVLLNGHGAAGQIETCKRLAVEFSNESSSRVINLFVIPPSLMASGDAGHATCLETCIQMYLDGENVDIQVLPPKDVPLKYKDYGIADDCMFNLKPSRDKNVIDDPRNANVASGEKTVHTIVDCLSAEVEKEYQSLT